MTTITHSDHDITHAPQADMIGCERTDDGIAVLRLGRASETVVTWTEERLLALQAVLTTLAADKTLAGVVITGPGPGMFCAGADINLIASIDSAAAGAAAAQQGRDIFAMLRKLPVPVVAAIEGPCLGGGFELALFCDLRVASDDQSTQLGLPEVKLGIVPGFGGTQNLTRLLGLPAALELILQGKMLRARPAHKRGLVDELAPSSKLLEVALGALRKLRQEGRKAPRRKLRGAAYWLSRTPLRKLVVDKVQKTLERTEARFYPAPRRALQLCLLALHGDEAEGFRQEAMALGELVATPVSKGLCHLFFLTERSKRLGKQPDAPSIDRALLVGGGVMGAGIGGLMAQKHIAVRLCDLDAAALCRAKARLQQDLDKRLRRRQLQKHEAMAVQDRLAVSSEWGDLRRTDLWLEAVVEDLAVKQQLMRTAVERGLPDSAIVATNTSSLPIDAMAEAVPAPERVVGIHFFNPPEKMPLCEVIRGARTSDAAVDVACKLAVRLGKFPVVVQDAPGFLVNRCLAPYLNEATRLLLEGNSPESIDRVMLDFGMPMGPCRLLDEVGFDVAAKVSEVLHAAFGARMTPSPLFSAMLAAKALGRKSGGGLYGANGKGPGPGRAVLKRLCAARAGGPTPSSRTDVLQRLVYPMIDEAWRCLDAGIVAEEQDLDLGLCMGIGFPPFTGGITRFARQEGLQRVVSALDELARRLDSRFAPGDGLRRRAVE